MSIPSRQTTLLLRKFGGPEELVVTEAAVPEPASGEVLVKMLAASVRPRLSERIGFAEVATAHQRL